MKLAVDLGAALTALSRHTEYKELSKRIKLFISARSFQLDLESAAQSIAHLGEIDPTDGEARFKIGQPLMLHAVMMYCRAAIEDGSGRHPMGVTSEFSTEQRKKHQDVVRLRNKSMAHFGLGEGEYGEKWIKEVPVLKMVEGKAHVTVAWKRANYLARLIADLDELTSVALTTVAKKLKDRREGLSELLFHLLEKDQKLLGILREYQFVPEEFFGSSASVDSFWGNDGRRHEIYTPRVTTSEQSVVVGPTVTTSI